MTGLATKYPGSGLISHIQIEDTESFWIPTSSPVLNHQLGGGGAYGRIMELSGAESSGKTLLALDLIKNAQKLGGVGVFVDAEYAFSYPWAELNGLDAKKTYVYQENIIEVISDFMAEISIFYRTQLTENEPIVLVLDSIAALDTQSAMTTSESDSKAEMGSRAKAIYKMIRLRNRLWAKLGVTVILINQLRDKINTGFGAKFQDSQQTVGGNAIKFFASQRVWFEAKAQLVHKMKPSNHRYGADILMTIKKNKLAMPRAPRRIKVIFDSEYGTLGFDRYEGLGEILLKKGVVTKDGNSYYMSDGGITTKIAQSRDGLDTVIATDKAIRGQLLRQAEILTLSQMQARLDDCEENRYPATNITYVSHVDSTDEDEEDDDDDS